MNPANIRRLLKYGKLPVAVYAVTVVTIVVTNLLTGILVGLGLSILKLLYAFSHLGLRVEKTGSNRMDVYLYGSATFIRLPKLTDALGSAPADADVHIHFQNLNYIDHACMDAISSWEQQRLRQGGKVTVEWTDLMEVYRDKNSSRPIEMHRGGADAPAAVTGGTHVNH